MSFRIVNGFGEWAFGYRDGEGRYIFSDGTAPPRLAKDCSHRLIGAFRQWIWSDGLFGFTVRRSLDDLTQPLHIPHRHEGRCLRLERGAR